jgi:hypothetical protein
MCRYAYVHIKMHVYYHNQFHIYSYCQRLTPLHTNIPHNMHTVKVWLPRLDQIPLRSNRMVLGLFVHRLRIRMSFWDQCCKLTGKKRPKTAGFDRNGNFSSLNNNAFHDQLLIPLHQLWIAVHTNTRRNIPQSVSYIASPIVGCYTSPPKET